MRLTKTVEKMVSVEELDSLACNCCGEYFTIDQSQSMQSFALDFGYASRHDMEHWSFDICDKCIEKIVDGFKIAPEITGNEEESWDYQESAEIEPVEAPRPNTLEPFRYV
ncbi:MAG TPA: hypothetical protein VIM70_11550 [Clostridium sp.]|uniref:hypothetical protein n=1 Tax=Clostridium sp. TaxID=1506 RepID=UPI002F930FE3